jgi:hypothetical protein
MQTLLEFLVSLQRVNPSDTSSVPARPGIYVWYHRPTIGTADWRKRLDKDGLDLGIGSLLQALANQTAKFAPPPLRTHAHSTFRDVWRGKLQPIGYERSVALARSGGKDAEGPGGSGVLPFPRNEIQRLMNSETQRGKLTTFLNENAAPMFAAPLYIGRANNLRERIDRHVQEMGKLYKLILKDPARRESLRAMLYEDDVQNQDSLLGTFAARVIASGFPPESLDVYILDIATAFDISEEAAKDMSAVCEWFLNTWNRPMFGRA